MKLKGWRGTRAQALFTLKWLMTKCLLSWPKKGSATQTRATNPITKEIVTTPNTVDTATPAVTSSCATS